MHHTRNGRVRGFHLNVVLASSFCAWSGIVTEFLSERSTRPWQFELKKAWVNTKLGKPGKSAARARTIWHCTAAVKCTRQPYRLACCATCGIDVQDDRFELELVGWGYVESGASGYQKICGDPPNPQIWEDLDNFLQTRWRREDGAVMNILAAAMDFGGHHTDAVYRFCLERWASPLRAIKGTRRCGNSVRVEAVNRQMWAYRCTPSALITAKTMSIPTFERSDTGSNYCHFPIG